MIVEIWSDFICPFCYIGERKFQRALEEFKHGDEVQIIFRSFELNPFAKGLESGDINEVIAKKYNISYDRAKATNDGIVKVASEIGLNFRFDLLKRNNTRKAHEIAKYASSFGKEKEIINCFFKSYLEEGIDIGDINLLLKLASEIGLDEIDLKEKLEKGFLKSQVIEDEERAKDMGINGVPFFLIDNKHTISGAKSPSDFLKVLNETYLEK